MPEVWALKSALVTDSSLVDRRSSYQILSQTAYKTFVVLLTDRHMYGEKTVSLTAVITCIALVTLILGWFCWHFHHRNTVKTRSTQRAQTSLAEADHYSHIAHCKNVEPWLCKTTHPLKKKKKKKKVSGSLPSPWSGYATTIMVFFCSFTHLTIPRSPPKFNQFFLVLLRTRP